LVRAAFSRVSLPPMGSVRNDWIILNTPCSKLNTLGLNPAAHLSFRLKSGISEFRAIKCAPQRKTGGGEAIVARAKKKKRPFNVTSFLSRANGGRTITSYRKNEKIFSQGDPADAVFYIREGKVKVCVISEAGKEAVVALHGKGDFFGEGCLTGQPLRLATVAAMTECVIMRLAKADIVRVLRDEPKFSDVFVAYLLARNARVEEDLVDQLFNSSEKRLARVLLLMANFGKEGKPEPVIAKISQETLAEIIGTTRSRVSTFMNKFRDLGFIKYNGDLEVHNSLLNVILHDKPQIGRGDNGN
jgi:CRP/FNR family transcriptional regulator, cyclic AMP receptor protein